MRLVFLEDGDWGMSCGGIHPQSADFWKAVGIGHMLINDPTIDDTLDLKEGHEAERIAIGAPWVRARIAQP